MVDGTGVGVSRPLQAKDVDDIEVVTGSEILSFEPGE